MRLPHVRRLLALHRRAEREEEPRAVGRSRKGSVLEPAEVTGRERRWRGEACPLNLRLARRHLARDRRWTHRFVGERRRRLGRGVSAVRAAVRHRALGGRLAVRATRRRSEAADDAAIAEHWVELLERASQGLGRVEPKEVARERRNIRDAHARAPLDHDDGRVRHARQPHLDAAHVGAARPPNVPARAVGIDVRARVLHHLRAQFGVLRALLGRRLWWRRAGHPRRGASSAGESAARRASAHGSDSQASVSAARCARARLPNPVGQLAQVAPHVRDARHVHARALRAAPLERAAREAAMYAPIEQDDGRKHGEQRREQRRSRRRRPER